MDISAVQRNQWEWRTFQPVESGSVESKSEDLLLQTIGLR